MKCFKHLTRAGKILLLSAVVAFAASTAFAESVESKSSEKIFRGDADYFNSTILWNNLELDKVYIESELTSWSLDIGAALNLGGFYISAYYNGNIAQSSSENNKTATAAVSELTGHDEYTTWAKVTNTEQDCSGWGPVNDIQVMVGIANMGIKLGYAGSGAAKSGKFSDLYGGWGTDITNSFTSAADSQSYTDTVYGKGKKFEGKKYVPMVGFGIDLGFIKPYVDVRLPIFANGGSYSNTVTTVTNGYTTQEKTTEAKKIDGYFGINPTIGAEIALGEDARIEASYTPCFYIYNKGNGSTVTTTNTVNYNVTDTNVGKQTINAESVTGAGNARFTMDNNVNLAFAYTKEVADRVTLGGKAGVGVGFNFDNETTRNNLTTTTTTSYDGKYNEGTVAGIAYETVRKTVIENPATKTNKTNVDVIPQLAGSVNFAAVPEKVSLIAGLGVNVKVAYEKTTTTHDMNVTTTTTTTTNSLTGLNQTTKDVTVSAAPGEESSNVVLTTTPEASAYLGAVFTPTKNFSISTCLNLKTLCNTWANGWFNGSSSSSSSGSGSIDTSDFSFAGSGSGNCNGSWSGKVANPFASLVVQAQVKF